MPKMITIKLNGETKTLEENLSLQQAIDSWNIETQSFAVAVNEDFIPKSNYNSTLLQANDEVELLIPMQGG